MNYGGSIALLVIGAILSFAVQDAINGIDLTLIGYILMAAGALWLIISVISQAAGSKTRTRESVVGSDGVNHERIVESQGRVN